MIVIRYTIYLNMILLNCSCLLKYLVQTGLIYEPWTMSLVINADLSMLFVMLDDCSTRFAVLGFNVVDANIVVRKRDWRPSVLDNFRRTAYLPFS